jgi:hypothetical protein
VSNLFTPTLNDSILSTNTHLLVCGIAMKARPRRGGMVEASFWQRLAPELCIP